MQVKSICSSSKNAALVLPVLLSKYPNNVKYGISRNFFVFPSMKINMLLQLSCNFQLIFLATVAQCFSYHQSVAVCSNPIQQACTRWTFVFPSMLVLQAFCTTNKTDNTSIIRFKSHTLSPNVCNDITAGFASFNESVSNS
jgi:hypothetical protein